MDDRNWVNSFGDNGWAFNKGDTPLVCFSITPRGSKFLRELLAKGTVKVRANVDSRYYEGVYPYVTGVIRGTDGSNAEEVLSLGHLYEIGAHDNATGVAAIIGATETLNRLIKAGRLARPKRTIRVLAMGECYGTMSYLEGNPERVKRTIAAMCIDSPAGPQNLAMTEYTWIINSAFVQILRGCSHVAVGRRVLPLGRPALALDGASKHHGQLPRRSNDRNTDRHALWGIRHSCASQQRGPPATVDPRSMRDMIVMNAAYTYFIASAGPAEKRWMAELALNRAYSQMSSATEKLLDQISLANNSESLGRLLHNSQEQIDYALERETKSVRSAADLKEALTELASFSQYQKARLRRSVRDRAAALGIGPVEPVAPARNAEAAKIVVRRKRMGNITLDNLPREKREGFPAASFWGVPMAALHWCDGKRNLEEVIRLTELEMGPQKFDFVGYFKFLERQGYVEFL